MNRRWYDVDEPGAGWRLLAGVYGRLAAGRGGRPAGIPPLAVIVVGNLTAGGSGKTPVVAEIVRLLKVEGYSPAIVSRGYGGPPHGNPMLVEAGDDPSHCADEPLMLARQCNVPVWVCRRRALALAAAVDSGADVVVSDDGLQHAAMPRSFEVCVVDGQRGFGNRHLLPAGPLRQSLDRLETVDRLLVRRPDSRRLVEEFGGLAFEIEAGEPYSLHAEGNPQGLSAVDDSVDAVCGIANPEGFFTLLERMGLSFRRHVFPDHHPYRATDFESIVGPVITTEKDAIKLAGLQGLPPTWVVPVRARLPEDFGATMLAHVREFRAS